MSDLWNKWKALRDSEAEQRSPNATPAEDFDRITRRRTMRLIKAWTAAVLVTPFAVPPLINAMVKGAEKITERFAERPDAFPGNEDAKPVQQDEKPKPREMSLKEIFGKVLDVAICGAYIAYAGRKGYQAYIDGKKLEAIKDERDWRQWHDKSAGKSPDDPSAGPS